MYARRATCNLNLKNYKEALNDANLAEKYYPAEGKSMKPDIYYLKTVSKMALNDYKGALNDAKKLKQFATENNDTEYVDVANDLLKSITYQIRTNSK